MIVETDAMEVIKSLNFETIDISDIELIVNEVISLTPKAGVVSFAKCPRKGNQIAHLLVHATTGF